MDAKKIAIVVAAIPAFLTPFMSSSVNIALPPIGREFEIDAILLGWIATSYLLAACILSIPFGRVADIKGIKKVFVAGIFIYSLGSFLSAIAPSVELLIVFRVVQGIGVAMDFATRMAILTSVFPPAERGKAIGINIGFTYAGLSLGPFLGGLLTQNFGWRSIFFINVPIGILALILAIWKLKGDWIGAKGEKFDFIGSIIYGFILLSIIYGLTESAVVYIFAGFILLIAFVMYESKVEHPVFEINLLRKNFTFSLSSLAALLNYSATFAVVFILSFYLQYVKSLTPQEAGLILIAQPVIMVIFAPFAGWLSDRIEPRVVASAGMAVATVSLFIFSGIGAGTPMSLIIANLMLLGFGLGLFASPNTNAIMGSVERKYFGIASATVATMRLIGQVLSMALVMLVFSVIIGRVEITPEYYPLLVESAKVSFMIFTAVCFAGIFASLGRGKMR
jgi:EmrB/QacA subfamily drug resistance transporter